MGRRGQVAGEVTCSKQAEVPASPRVGSLTGSLLQKLDFYRHGEPRSRNASESSRTSCSSVPERGPLSGRHSLGIGTPKKQSGSSVWSGSNGGLAQRQDFGPGFGSCSICAKWSINRGCSETKKIVCSKCWPGYLQGRLGLSFVGGVSAMSDVGSILDYEEDEPFDEQMYIQISSGGYPQTPSVGSWLMTAPRTPLHKMAEAAKARLEKKNELHHLRRAEKPSNEAKPTYKQGQVVEVLRSNGKWEPAKVSGTLADVTASKPQGYLEIHYYDRTSGKKQIHHSKLAAYVRPSKAHAAHSGSPARSQEKEELGTPQKRITRSRKTPETPRRDGKTRTTEKAEPVQAAQEGNDEAEPRTASTPVAAKKAEDCIPTSEVPELIEKKVAVEEESDADRILQSYLQEAEDALKTCEAKVAAAEVTVKNVEAANSKAQVSTWAEDALKSCEAKATVAEVAVKKVEAANSKEQVYMQVQRDPTPTRALASDEAAIATAKAKASEVLGKCTRGHAMIKISAWSSGTCDGCEVKICRKDRILECKQCDPNWWLCGRCASKQLKAAAAAATTLESQADGFQDVESPRSSSQALSPPKQGEPTPSRREPKQGTPTPSRQEAQASPKDEAEVRARTESKEKIDDLELEFLKKEEEAAAILKALEENTSAASKRFTEIEEQRHTTPISPSRLSGASLGLRGDEPSSRTSLGSNPDRSRTSIGSNPDRGRTSIGSNPDMGRPSIGSNPDLVEENTWYKKEISTLNRALTSVIENQNDKKERENQARIRRLELSLAAKERNDFAKMVLAVAVTILAMACWHFSRAA